MTFTDRLRLEEGFSAAMDMSKSIKEDVGLIGYGLIVVRDPLGRIKDLEPFANQITTVGDTYYATRAVAGIGTPNIAQPSPLLTGMKLGTGGTAVAKSGAGAALVTYLTGSNAAFGSAYPQLEDLTGDTGFNAVYQVVWAAGVATNSAITEAALVTDAGTNATSDAAHTAARILFASKNKTVDDSLTITWKHLFNG